MPVGLRYKRPLNLVPASTNKTHHHFQIHSRRACGARVRYLVLRTASYISRNEISNETKRNGDRNTAAHAHCDYSGTPLNGHPSTTAICDITANSTGPDQTYVDFCSSKPLNNSHLDTPYNGQLRVPQGIQIVEKPRYNGHIATPIKSHPQMSAKLGVLPQCTCTEIGHASRVTAVLSVLAPMLDSAAAAPVRHRFGQG